MYDSSESEWRRITRDAEDARLLMMRDREAGERAFLDLLSRHPKDGMVPFKRGEAYEYLGEYALAIRDYERAAERFPRPAYRLEAQHAIARTEARRAQVETMAAAANGGNTPITAIQHKRALCTACSRLLDQIPGIDAPLQQRVLAPFWWVDDSPRLAAGSLHQALRHVISALHRNRRCVEMKPSALIKSVRAREPEIVRDVECILALRTDPPPKVSATYSDVLAGLEAMNRILAWWKDSVPVGRHHE